MEYRFLTQSPVLHELALLLAIHRRGSLPLPLDPALVPSVGLEQVPLGRLIEEGWLAMQPHAGSERITLTPQGERYLRALVIDYHLELMALRRSSDEFVADRVNSLRNEGCRRIILYGASDTARVLLAFLPQSGIVALAVVDDDVRKQGQTLEGVPIIPPTAAVGLDFDSVVVTTVAFQDVILRERSRFIPGGKRMLGLFDDFERPEISEVK